MNRLWICAISSFFLFMLFADEIQGQITLDGIMTTEGPDAEEMLNRGHKRYLVESGMRVVTWDGMGATIDTIYWTNWGFTEVTIQYNKKKFLKGKKNLEPQAILIVDGANQYNYNPESNTYTRMNNPFVKAIEDEEGDYIEGTERIITERMGGEYIGDETFMGKPCKIYEVLGGRTWVWKGIGLKGSAKLLGLTSTYEVTYLALNTTPPAARMTLPEGAQDVFSGIKGNEDE